MEVWGCGRQPEQVEQVQIGVARIFLGRWLLRLKVAQVIVKMLPLNWAAKQRCCLKVVRMGDYRLIRLVVLEAMETRAK